MRARSACSFGRSLKCVGFGMKLQVTPILCGGPKICIVLLTRDIINRCSGGINKLNLLIKKV